MFVISVGKKHWAKSGYSLVCSININPYLPETVEIITTRDISLSQRTHPPHVTPGAAHQVSVRGSNSIPPILIRPPASVPRLAVMQQTGTVCSWKQQPVGIRASRHPDGPDSSQRKNSVPFSAFLIVFWIDSSYGHSCLHSCNTV